MSGFIDDLKLNILGEWVETLPEKALNFGIKVILTIIFFMVGSKLISVVRKIIQKSLERAKADVGVIQFLDAFVKVALYLLLLFSLASSFGLEAASVVAILGSAGVAIGLALQGSLSNLAGGLLILLLKPFIVGDYITESTYSYSGTIEDIGLFYTKLKMTDNKMIVMPNGMLANNGIINATAMNMRRLDMIIGVSYKANLKEAKECLLEVVTTEELILKTEEIIVYVDELGESSVNIGIRCWSLNENFWKAKWNITENVKYALDKRNIEIPYQKMDIFIKEKE